VRLHLQCIILPYYYDYMQVNYYYVIINSYIIIITTVNNIQRLDVKFKATIANYKQVRYVVRRNYGECIITL